MEDHSNAPVPSAELRVGREGVKQLTAEADADPSGRFQLDGLPAGDYRIELVRPNYVTATVRIHLGRTAAAVTLRLIRHAFISGRITDSNEHAG